MAVFWVVAPCSLVEVYQRFRGAAIIRAIALMMEAASTSETSVNVYQTTWRNNPEDSHIYTSRHENLKSHRFQSYLTIIFQLQRINVPTGEMLM
jgi:hypothetical protein